IENLHSIEIPISVPLKRTPAVHSSLAEVLNALKQLETFNGDTNTAPYLEVRVLLEGPEPGLRHKVETALQGKNYRLAKIDVRYAASSSKSKESKVISSEELKELQPMEVLDKVYQSKYSNPVPKDLQRLFQQIAQEVNETDN